MLDKRCKKCGLYSLKKNWNRNWKQRFKCKKCWYVFENKSGKVIKKLWLNYTEGKQTYVQLSERYWLSIPTIRNRLDTFKLKNFVD
jgi:transposase-like protein